MKKIAKILIAIGIGLIVAGVVLWEWKCNPPAPVQPTVDTTKYTDVVLVNKSQLDSVQVFVTLQGTESIIGLFGMDSSNIVTYCTDSVPCVGSFWAKKTLFRGFLLLFTPSETNFTKSYFRDEITNVFHMFFYLIAGCNPAVNPINSQITCPP